MAPGTWWRWRSWAPSARWTSSPTASAPSTASSAPPRPCSCRPSSNAEARVKKSDFAFDLPPALIAQAPLAERSASRMLVLPAGDAPTQDRQVRDLPGFLRAGDLRVFNDTRVIPARLFGRKQGSGGRVESLIERLLPGNEARAQVGASKTPRPGNLIELDAGGLAEVVGRDGGFHHLRFHVDGALQ